MIGRLKKLTKTKKILLGIALLLLIGIGIQIYRANTKKPNYTFGTVTRSDITEIVSETGKISTTGITPVLSPANGIVTNIYVENGDDVTVGETLFIINSTATEQQKSLALSNYLSAKSSLEAANSNALKLQATMFGQWKTFKDLAESDTYEEADGKPKDGMRTLAEFHISQKEWLAAEKDFQNQQTTISQAQAAVNSTYLLYQATQNATVKATAAGHISNLSVTPEGSVTATDTKPLALIVGHSKTEATVLLSENDVTKIQKGQTATIEMKALRGKTYHGIVNRVDSIGIENKGVIRYDAYIEITDGTDAIRPGMNVDVVIITNTKKDVLSVPNAAVKPYKGGRSVRVIGKNKQIEYLPVEIGIRGKEKTEIKSGLQNKQEIIISLPNEQLKRPGGMFGG